MATLTKEIKELFNASKITKAFPYNTKMNLFDFIALDWEQPLHQREQIMNNDKARRWIADMLFQQYEKTVYETKSAMENAEMLNLVADTFGIKSVYSGNKQQFGVWINTKPTPDYPYTINVEEGLHRCAYATKFKENEIEIDRNFITQFSQNRRQALEEILAFCKTDTINYHALEDAGLNFLIDNIEVDIEVLVTDDAQRAKEVFAGMNNCVAVSNSDKRLNLYVDYYMWKLFDDLHDCLEKTVDFDFCGVHYTASDSKHLKNILPISKSKGKYINILTRCLMSAFDKNDGNNWHDHVSQDELTAKLFKRYSSLRNTPDKTAEEDLTVVIQTLLKMSKAMNYTPTGTSSTGSLFGIKNGNYTKGLTVLPSVLVSGSRKIEIKFGSKSTAQYNAILTKLDKAIIRKGGRYNEDKYDISYLSNTAQDRNRTEYFANNMVKIADLFERRGYRI